VVRRKETSPTQPRCDAAIVSALSGRREFITLLAAPCACMQSGPMRRIGVLMILSADDAEGRPLSISTF